MSDTTYTLEWRGTVKSGLSYEDIETGLVTGDLHTLYKIQVNGRRLVLRDFVEQQRPLLAPPPVRNLPPQVLPQIAGGALPRPDLQSAVPPPPPMGRAATTSLPMHSLSAGGKAPKPVWFWPAIILSSTTCLLLGVVFVYFIASSFSSNRRSNTTTNTSSTSTSAGSEGKGEAKARVLKILPYSRAGKEFFPSALVSTSNVRWNNQDLDSFGPAIFGDEGSWMGMELQGMKKDAKVSVAITVDGFTKPSKWEGEITSVSEDGAAMIMPKLIWDYAALLKVRQQRPVNVSFTASVDGKPLPEVTETYTMRSINDCPLLQLNADGKGETDLSFLFAAYVNEGHPQLQKILKEALDTGLVDKFNGYQGDPEKPEEIRMQVMKQVFAIWNALQRRGIKYSSITNTPPGDRMFCQSVRFLDESIDNRSANCVDGTVLMASVLQKIGIQSYLVLVPGHCFLAFNEIKNSAALPTGLETTMLGRDDITNVKKLEFLSDAEQSKENMASANTFVEALARGSGRIQGCVLNLQGGSSLEYRLISIREARNLGIKPIMSEQ